MCFRDLGIEGGLLASALLALLLPAATYSEELTPHPEPPASAAAALPVRVSQVIEMPVQDQRKRPIGKVVDIVIDANGGEANYVIVSLDGPPANASELHAVPWHALQWRKGQEDVGLSLVLKATKRQLLDSPGFHPDHWPDFTKREFTNRVDRQFGRRRPIRRLLENVDVDVGRDGVNVDVGSGSDGVDVDVK